jgi:hypothetical protein
MTAARPEKHLPWSAQPHVAGRARPSAEKLPAFVSLDLANKSRLVNIYHDTPVSPLRRVSEVPH